MTHRRNRLVRPFCALACLLAALEMSSALAAGPAVPSDAEARHLEKLSAHAPFPFVRDDTTSFFLGELRRLRSLKLIEGQDGKGVRSPSMSLVLASDDKVIAMFSP